MIAADADHPDRKHQPVAAPRTIDWGRAVFGGAVGAGVLWGYLLNVFVRSQDAVADGAPSAPPFLLLSAAYCAVLLLAGAVLLSLASGQHLRTLGAAVTIAGGVGTAIVAMPWALLGIVLVPLAAYGFLRIRQHRVEPHDRQPAPSKPAEPALKSQHSITVRDSPVGLLSGLFVGALLAYPFWIFGAFFAIPVLIVLGVVCLVSRQTDAFGVGMLAAAAGVTSLSIVFYAIIANFG